jgi:MarR-like DNA-binding transcriptional regulator SgrR of sgrS sRNA
MEPTPVPPPGEESVDSGPKPTPPVRPPEAELVPQPEPRRGGWIHVLVGGAAVEREVVRANVREGLAPGGLLLGLRRPRTDDPCWGFWVIPNAAFPDGRAVEARDLVNAWARGLADETRDDRWLLDPLLARSAPGAMQPPTLVGINADGQFLEVCPPQPVPDLPLRLEHPALWLGGERRTGGLFEGPGPFYRTPDGTLYPNPGHQGPGPYVERVEVFQVDADPSIPFRLGDAQVAILFGKAAGKLRSEATARSGFPLSFERVPSWDRTYFLWLDPEKRWVNDPRFRKWVSAVLDRDEMLAYLFDGQGDRAFSLSPGGSPVPVYEDLQPDRPLSPTSVPRLTLLYDEEDAQALTLARRVQAVLATHQVELSLVARRSSDLRRALATGEAEAALLAHRPATRDPLLGLLGSTWWFGRRFDGLLDPLLRAASEIAPGRRAERAEMAWEVEQGLLVDARVVPLVRLHAWLAHHPKLSGVETAPGGLLILGEAWWLP